MADYRLYLLNSEGHITRATDLSAETDAEALVRARAMAKDRPIELWEGARCVLAWSANASSAGAPGVAGATQKPDAPAPHRTAATRAVSRASSAS
jgi:hypothetical protein